MQKGYELNAREIAKINERKVFKAIKKLPKQGEYFVASLTELARVAQIPEGSMNAIIKRLERKRINEINEKIDYKLPDNEYQELNEQLGLCEKAREFNEKLLDEYKWKKDKNGK